MKIRLEDLSIEEKLGQMLMVGVEKNHITQREIDLIQKYKVGGFILYRKNFKSYDELINLINELKQANSVNKIPLFIAIDQEGGRVNRLPKQFENLPSALELANSNSIDKVSDAYNTTGELLYELGFNMNLAPVLDIKRFSNGHAIGNRSFGDNVEVVSKYGIECMQQLQKNHIVSVLKHFPGHGATQRDSHYYLPVIKSSIKELENNDMKVFENAINSGAEAILVGHLIVRNVTGIFPASLSRKFIGEYLRKKYRYNGLVITDDLKMKAIKFIYGEIFSFIKAVEAGNDIIIFRYSKRKEKQSIDELLKLAKSNKINKGRINRSVKRILKVKEKYQLNNEKISTNLDINCYNEKILKIKNS